MNRFTKWITLRMSLFVLVLGAIATTAEAQQVNHIYTDFAGWWSSGTSGINATKPNDAANLLGFTTVRVVNGVPVARTFSTGVNDALLTSKGISFTAGNYRALPVAQISGTPSTSTYVGTGNRYGGVDRSVTHPDLPNPMNYYLTDGINGLDMGTAVYNIQSGSIFYKVDEFNIAAIGDGMADIIATQMGDYPSASDVFKFIDINGQTVGNAITLDFSQVLSVGNASWTFYGVPNTSPYYPMKWGGPHGDRLIRLRAWDISDFGIDQNNVGRVARFVHTLSGFSDPAFMAYNTSTFRALTKIDPTCTSSTVSPGFWVQATDGITLSGSPAKVTTWSDQSALGLSMEQSTATVRPDYKDGRNPGFNFNPYVDFDPNNWMGHSNSPFTATSTKMEVYLVGRPTANSGTNKILGFTRNNADFIGTSKGDYNATNFNSSGRLSVTNGSTTALTSTAGALNSSGLWRVSYDKATTSVAMSYNGVAAGSASNATLDLGTWYTQLGDAAPGDNQSDFDLAEVMVFNGIHTTDDREKIQSYLGIKYGITLPHKYVSGAGNVIWDYTNATYNNNILGVGREDCQGLAQKQSLSITDTKNMLTVGLGSIAVSNKENLSSLSDSQYLIFGDNAGSLTSTVPTQFQRLCLTQSNLKWRVQRTGEGLRTATSQARIHVSEVAWNEAALQNTASNYYLLIDRNGNGIFTDAADEAIAASSYDAGFANFSNVVWDKDGSGTDLFTVALKLAEMPVLSAIAGPERVCRNSTITLTSSAVTGVWSSSNTAVATVNASTGVVTGVTAGTATITFTVTNERGCSVAISKTITVSALPTAVISGGSVVCENSPLPPVNVAFTGTGPWSFAYSDGTTTSSVTNVTTTSYQIPVTAQGTYVIKAMNDVNCPGTFSGQAIEKVVKVQEVKVIHPACVGEKGSIEVITSVDPTFTYSIDGTNYQSSPLFNNLSAGTYQVTVRNGSCVSLPYAAVINSSPTAPTPVVTQPSCTVATGRIAIPEVAGATYSINNGGSYSSTASFNALAAGTYQVVVKFANGCVSPAQVVTINPQPATPTAPVSESTVYYCAGQTAQPLAATGTRLLWYTASTDGVGNATAPTPTTTAQSTQNYYVSQTNDAGCESSRKVVAVQVKANPAAPAVSVLNNCDASSTLTATTYTGSLLWNTGATTASTVVRSAGTYTLTQVVDGCTSPTTSVVAAPKSTPAAPVIAVSNNCNGKSVLTASGFTGQLLWSNGSTSTSQEVDISSTYYLIQTVNGCDSPGASATTSIQTVPSAPTAAAQSFCTAANATVSNLVATGNAIKWYKAATGGTALASTEVLTAGNYYASQTSVGGCESTRTTVAVTLRAAPAAPTVSVVDNCNGTSTLTASNYTGTLLWNTTETTATITVSTAGSYSVTQTVNSCASTPASATAAPKTAVSAPTVSVVDNCNGTSTLTATNYTGTLLWSNNQTTATITVSTAGSYSVTQTVNGCTSAAASATAAPKVPVAAPTVAVVDNCNGTSTLTASNYTGALLWNTTETTATITVNTAGSYSVTQTLNGCTSTPASATAAPKAAVSAPTVAVVNNCNGTSTLTASNYTGTLLWSTNESSTSIVVNTAGSYSVTQTINGCTSASASATAAPKTAVSAPTVAVVDNCNGTSTLTASNYTGTLLWSTNESSTSIVVNTAGSYSVTQTINGCTSASASGVAAPKTAVSAPTVAVVDNCNGTSTLTASNYTGTLLWSTNETTESITVNTAGSYSVTQTINGCTSASASATAAPKTAVSAPTVAVVDNCNGTSTLTAGNHTGTLLWSTNETSESIVVNAAGSYSVTQTINGCTSASASATAAPKTAVSAPTVSVVDNCNGTSTLTAGNHTGTLLWSTNETSESIVVNAAGSYSVTQTINGCTSASASATAAPKTAVSAPTVSVVDNCNGTSTLTASNYTGTLLWSTNETTESITVNTAGSYSVTQTINGCTSASASATAAPKTAVSAPTVSVVDNCNGTSTLTASNYTGTLLWSTNESSTSIVVNTAGSYSVTQTINGCTSASASGTAAPKTAVSAPTVAVVDNCNGTSTLTASNYTGTLLWSTNETSESIVVNAAGSYSVTQTINGCTSASASATAAPKTAVSAPTVAVVDNCNGTSTLTAGNHTGTLLWSTNETTESITVNTAGSYSVTQTINGCTSASASATAAPKTAVSAPTVSVVDNCNGTSTLTAGNHTGTLLWSTNETTESITVNTAGSYSVTQTINGCTSASASGTAAPKAPIAAPLVTDQVFNAVTNPTVRNLKPSESIQWYATATGGSPLAASTPLHNGSYYASVVNNGCESPRSEVKVTILDQLDAGPDQAKGSQTFKMAATGGPGKWSVVSVSTGGTLTDVQIQDLTDPNTSVTIPKGTTVTLRWTVDRCDCYDEVRITESSPLPVTFISFTGKVVESTIQLNWITTYEKNNAGYIVERSTNLKDFTVLGFVSAATNGNSTQKLMYSFVDHDPQAVVNYYRLTQKDKDGTTTMGKVIAVDNRSDSPKAILYPVPAYTKITVKGAKPGATFQLINSMGQKLSETTESVIDISTLPGGRYYIRVIEEKGTQLIRFSKE